MTEARPTRTPKEIKAGLDKLKSDFFTNCDSHRTVKEAFDLQKKRLHDFSVQNILRYERVIVQGKPLACGLSQVCR